MPQKYTNLSSLFTDIANAIREKKGTNESIIADNFPDEISSIESGSDIINFEENFLKRTAQLSIYENSHATVIGDGVFYSYSTLTSVSFPQATSIGSYAFFDCFKLTSVSFPLATSIGNRAFASCSSLTSISFPQVTNIGYYAFGYCRSLASVNFPQATNIGSYAFMYCDSLTSISFPQVTRIENYAFNYCSSLTLVNFPQATNIGSYAFMYCDSLTSIMLGGQQSQQGIIYPYAFFYCYHLTDLHLQGSYLYSLSNSNAFTSTPIGGYSASAGKFGNIYVPASLYSQYISATNWAYFSSRFVSV